MLKKTLLMSLLFISTSSLARPHPASQAMAQTEGKVITITAKRFAFSPDHITLKRGEPVTLRLISEDVTHGFFVRALKADELVEPGKTVDVKVDPKTAGTFTAICHHFCGSGHGNMKMTITVE